MGFWNNLVDMCEVLFTIIDISDLIMFDGSLLVSSMPLSSLRLHYPPLRRAEGEFVK